MNINTTQIPGLLPGSATAPSRAVNPADGPSFTDVIRDVISDTSNLQDEARNAIDAFVRGEPIELHQVMAATEEASLSLEMLVEMRNRFVEAYRTIINMQ